MYVHAKWPHKWSCKEDQAIFLATNVKKKLTKNPNRQLMKFRIKEKVHCTLGGLKANMID